MADAICAQKVVIVNGGADILEMLSTALDEGDYEILFVESFHAYSQIKNAQPTLVILCTSIHDLEGLQVLSMLKLDRATRDIPVLTYTTESMDPDDDVLNEASVFSTNQAPARMN